jgi:hypothetical protein
MGQSQLNPHESNQRGSQEMSENQTKPKKPYTVPEAGGHLHLSPQASYAAARRGEIPTFKLAGKLFVPALKWDRMVAGED